MATFPMARPRRLRRTAQLREMVRETRLHPSAFVLPLFVVPGRDVANPIPSMPGVSQWSVDRVGDAVAPAVEAGVRGVILFGVPEAKDAVGSHAWRDDGPVQRALAELRRAFPKLVLITATVTSPTIRHSNCSRARRCRTRAPARTSSRRRT
jgi:porphobilinogen synthase